MRKVLSCCLWCVALSIPAQLKYGPVCGGVTDTSASILVGCASTDTVYFTLFSDTLFASSVTTIKGLPRPYYDTTVLFSIKGLQPGKWYGYSISQGTDTVRGIFHTFDFSGQNQSPFRIAFGSCIGYTDSIFLLIAQYSPDLTVIVGDWGYYDNPLDSATDTIFFCDDWANLMLSWEKRYSMPVLKEYMRSHAIAYVWSDHDFTADGACQYSATFYDTVNIRLDTVPYRAFTTYNSTQAYIHMFPHYPLVDSSDGIYQKILLPFTEAFLTDYRSRKNAYAKAFTKSGGNWQFTPPPGHTTLGAKQRQWLFDGIKNSQACWKIIFSDNVFNKKFRFLMNKLLGMQNINPLFALAGMGLAEWWCGYPYDQDTLIDIVQKNSIQGVLVASGDIHTAAMDDGTNAGLPEAIAGGLGQINSCIASMISWAGENPATYFNKGAQCWGNNSQDNRPAFGLIEIYGCDSLVVKLINSNNNIIASMKLLHTGMNNKAPHGQPECDDFNQYYILTPEGKIVEKDKIISPSIVIEKDNQREECSSKKIYIIPSRDR